MAEEKRAVTMDKLVNLCKARGIIFPGSEIYGGMGNTWDYGPIGVEIKNNIKRAWWKRFVQESDNSYGIDAAILMNSRVWEASGHTTSFSDPKMDCKECKSRHRADNLIEAHSKGKVNPDVMTNEEMEAYIREHRVCCPICGKFNWTNIRTFNLMFETSRGVTDESQNKIYLRPETAQGEFVNFMNVQRTTRAKVPFGIAQIGKAFRNEITPGNFIFRTIEFEQMEHQWFCKEGTDVQYYGEFKQKAWKFLTDLNGIHNRTDYDLSRHQEFSGKTMQYIDPVTNEKYIPYVVEYSIGADRLMLAVLTEAYDEETLSDGETRVVLHLHPALAAYKAAVLPLQKNLSEKAEEIFKELRKHFPVTYDAAGSIGKRYRRQDEIGTPYCITIDFDTLNDGTVTVRDRDTMEQVRIHSDELAAYISQKIIF